MKTAVAAGPRWTYFDSWNTAMVWADIMSRNGRRCAVRKIKGEWAAAKL